MKLGVIGVVVVLVLTCGILPIEDATGSEISIRYPKLSFSKKTVIVSGTVSKGGHKAVILRRLKADGTVDVREEDEFDGAWLGVTAIVNGVECDMRPRKLRPGNFKEEFTTTEAGFIENVAKTGDYDVRWVARLWLGIVYPNVCRAMNDGVECKWCRGEHKCHMYQLLDEAKL